MTLEPVMVSVPPNIGGAPCGMAHVMVLEGGAQ